MSKENMLDEMETIFELVTDITKECFKRCIPKITDRIDPHERTCLEQCFGRIIDTNGFIVYHLMKSKGIIE